MTLQKNKTTWDLAVFYTSIKDPRIEKDQATTDRAYTLFAKKYRKSKVHLKNSKALAKALHEYEALMKLPGGKAGYYGYFRKDLNIEDKEAEALLAKLDERATQRSNELIFFPLEIGKVSKTQQQKFLKSAELKPFRYALKQMFDDAKYTLSEPEEKILSLKSDVSHGRWVQATENILNKQVVRVGKKELPLPEAEMSLQALPTKKRRALYTKIRERYATVSDIAESEINAIYTNKKINDELRGYKTPYEATIRGYENEVQGVLALVDAVTKAKAVSERFYTVKAKLLNEKKLTYADRSASVGEIGSRFTFDASVKTVREVFGNLDPKYAEIVDRLIKNSQVDVYPKKGKGGGAYCAGGVAMPTFVFLNHVDTFESFKTLAHEMGHAIHTERSKLERPLYERYSTTTAETASTFFEYAALHHVVNTLPERDKIIALHNIIQDDIATIFRQIAFFNFEKSLHEAVRRDGYVSKQDIARLMNQAMQAYIGSVMEFVPEDGYFFVALSHMRRFFYVYSYAYGQLVSKAMHKKLEKDSRFIREVDQFLTAGGNASVEDIFGSIGINTRTSKVFEDGIASIEADVKLLEKLVG